MNQSNPSRVKILSLIAIVLFGGAIALSKNNFQGTKNIPTTTSSNVVQNIEPDVNSAAPKMMANDNLDDFLSYTDPLLNYTFQYPRIEELEIVSNNFPIQVLQKYALEIAGFSISDLNPKNLSLSFKAQDFNCTAEATISYKSCTNDKIQSFENASGYEGYKIDRTVIEKNFQTNTSSKTTDHMYIYLLPNPITDPNTPMVYNAVIIHTYIPTADNLSMMDKINDTIKLN